MTYKILVAEDRHSLEDLVNSYISKPGWRPQGGISIVFRADEDWERHGFAQAVVFDPERMARAGVGK